MQSGRPMQSGSGFSKSIDGIATVVAVAITFFLAPLVIGASGAFVREFATVNYGDGWVPAASFIWMLVAGGFLFYATRALAIYGAMLWIQR